ncbi:MAG: hypothetical protein AAGB93_09555 [Planctomycetota bacterium]
MSRNTDRGTGRAARRARAGLLAITAGLVACSGGDSDGPAPVETRATAMAFTPWPYDATLAAVTFTYDQILANGDWVAHHLDLGVPWEEALQGDPYPAAVENELAGRVANTPLGTPVYLAVTPLNVARDGLAANWGATGAEPLPAPWDTRGFADAEVAQAYTSYVADLVGRFQPACLNFAIEVSELALNDAAEFQAFLGFEAAVVADLRAQFPELPLMVSVGLKSPTSAEMATLRAEMPAALAHVDWVGLSVYPYAFFDHADRGDPANLPADWFSQGVDLAGGKPVAVAETGWIAEDLVIPAFSLNVPADEDDQARFVQTLLAECARHDARFVTWFTIADFDALWNGVLGQDPLAQIWRDTGLFDGIQVARPGLAEWQARLSVPLR